MVDFKLLCLYYWKNARKAFDAMHSSKVRFFWGRQARVSLKNWDDYFPLNSPSLVLWLTPAGLPQMDGPSQVICGSNLETDEEDDEVLALQTIPITERTAIDYRSDEELTDSKIVRTFAKVI